MQEYKGQGCFPPQGALQQCDAQRVRGKTPCFLPQDQYHNYTVATDTFAPFYEKHYGIKYGQILINIEVKDSKYIIINIIIVRGGASVEQSHFLFLFLLLFFFFSLLTITTYYLLLTLALLYVVLFSSSPLLLY